MSEKDLQPRACLCEVSEYGVNPASERLLEGGKCGLRAQSSAGTLGARGRRAALRVLEEEGSARSTLRSAERAAGRTEGRIKAPPAFGAWGRLPATPPCRSVWRVTACRRGSRQKRETRRPERRGFHWDVRGVPGWPRACGEPGCRLLREH